MANDMAFKDIQYPLSEYDNIINEITLFINIYENQINYHNSNERFSDENQQTEQYKKGEILIAIIECFKYILYYLDFYRSLIDELIKTKPKLKNIERVKKYMDYLKGCGNMKDISNEEISNLFNITISCLDVVIV